MHYWLPFKNPLFIAFLLSCVFCLYFILRFFWQVFKVNAWLASKQMSSELYPDDNTTFEDEFKILVIDNK